MLTDGGGRWSSWCHSQRLSQTAWGDDRNVVVVAAAGIY